MKYALIGCGRISPNHIEAAKNNNLNFVAMCDILPKTMEEKSDKFGLGDVRKYADYKEMLENETPELVAIATESGKHAQIALDCISAGCHVIIEKPIALSIADANAIIAAGKEKGVVVCANHQNRFNKSVQYMRKALEEGRFGRSLSERFHGPQLSQARIARAAILDRFSWTSVRASIRHRARADDRSRRQGAGLGGMGDQGSEIEGHIDAGVGLAKRLAVQFHLDGTVQFSVLPRLA